MGSDTTVVASSSAARSGGLAGEPRQPLPTRAGLWGTGDGPSGPDLTPPTTRQHGDASPNIAVNGSHVETGLPPAEALADAIIERFHPVAVLDACCGDGALVAALRRRGVDAAGIDRSAELLAGAADAARPHLAVGDPREPLAGHYDVILGVGLISEVVGADIERVVATLASAADQVVLAAASADTDLPDSAATWATAFARAGLLRDPAGPLAAAGPRALVLSRQDAESVAAVVAAYEAHLAGREAEAAELRWAVVRLRAELASLQRREERTVAALTETLRLRDLLIVKERRLGEVEGENMRLLHELDGYDDLVQQYDAVVHSTVWRTAWKVLGPYRRMRARLGV